MLDLKKKYNQEAQPAMREKFKYRNTLAVPKLTKVVINVGLGKWLKDDKLQEEIARDLARLSGQKPVKTLAKKAISGFKIREKMVVGLKVTLRRRRMYDFLNRLVNATLPRLRDFRGLPVKSIDQNGNLNIGIKEHIIFPEFSDDDIKTIFGLEISIVNNAKKREEAIELFRLLGFPLKKEK